MRDTSAGGKDQSVLVYLRAVGIKMLEQPAAEDIHLLSEYINTNNLPKLKEYLDFHSSQSTSDLINFHDHENDTPLMKACVHGNVDIEKELIFNGAGINLSSLGITPLIKAIWYNRSETVSYLIELGANVNQCIEGLISSNYSPLMVAVELNRLDILRILLNAQANINFQEGHEGWTALMVAAYVGNIDIVRNLLVYGADTMLNDFKKRTALDIAKERRQLEVVELLLWGPEHDPHERDEDDIRMEIGMRKESHSLREDKKDVSQNFWDGDDDDLLMVYSRPVVYHRYASLNSDTEYDTD